MYLRNLDNIDAALRLVADSDTRISFSQFGEDLIVASMLGTFGLDLRQGRYVDVGACHPGYLSNTKLLYINGWRGINIDGNPGAMPLFQRERPDDINITALVSDEVTTIEFTRFNDPAVDTADPEARDRIIATGTFRVIDTTITQTRRLDNILDSVIIPESRIDLMSVDVEGYELRVLRSNNWYKYAPHILLVEDQQMTFVNSLKTPIHEFLAPIGYRLVSQAFITSIYVRDQI